MFAHAAQRMGYHVGVFCQESGGPASQAADWEIVAPWEDLDAVERFAKRVDCVTLESENIPLSVVQTALRFAPVRPGARALEISQHRIREKQTLQQAGIEVTPFHPVLQPEDLKLAAKLLGAPFILKTATMGYDGKGQRMIESIDEPATILKAMGGDQWIAEKRIELAAEVSVLVARTPSGETSWTSPRPLVPPPGTKQQVRLRRWPYGWSSCCDWKGSFVSNSSSIHPAL
jgi:5-(carboxyamino)imidazole ribonucleotide synthase